MYLIVERRTRDMSRKEPRPVPGYGATIRLAARKSDRTVRVGKADGLVFAGRAEHYAWPMFCGQRSQCGQHPRRKEVVRQESREKQ